MSISVRRVGGSSCADKSRIDDNDKLREKVDEALAVFNDYVKTQTGDGMTSKDVGSAEQQPNGDGEETKA